MLKSKRIIDFIVFSLFTGVLLSTPVLWAEESSTNSAIRANQLLPESNAVKDWKIVEGPKYFTPESLYIIMNGADTFYLNFGFRELAHARYQRQDDDTLNVTIDIFDQGDVDGGFGVYSSGRHSDEKFRKIGTQGYRNGSLLIAWQDRYYISLMGDDERPDTINALEQYAKMITAKIPGKKAYPEFTNIIPKKNRIANTELYASKDYLGYRFLDRTICAKYLVNSATVTLFASDCHSQEKAKKVFKQTAEAIGPMQPVTSTLGEDLTIHAAEDKYLGKMIILQKERYVYGVFDPDNLAQWQSLQSLISQVTRKPKDIPLIKRQ